MRIVRLVLKRGVAIVSIAAAVAACGSKSDHKLYSVDDVRRAFAAAGEPVKIWPGSEAISKKHHMRGVLTSSLDGQARAFIQVFDYVVPQYRFRCTSVVRDVITGQRVGGCETVARIGNVQVHYNAHANAAESARIRRALEKLRRHH